MWRSDECSTVQIAVPGASISNVLAFFPATFAGRFIHLHALVHM